MRRIEKKKREGRADQGGDEDSNSVIETARWKLLLFLMLFPQHFSPFTVAVKLCYEMAIAAAIVLRGSAEKSNFIDIQGEEKDSRKTKKKKKNIF